MPYAQVGAVLLQDTNPTWSINRGVRGQDVASATRCDERARVQEQEYISSSTGTRLRRRDGSRDQGRWNLRRWRTGTEGQDKEGDRGSREAEEGREAPGRAEGSQSGPHGSGSLWEGSGRGARRFLASSTLGNRGVRSGTGVRSSSTRPTGSGERGRSPCGAWIRMRRPSAEGPAPTRSCPPTLGLRQDPGRCRVPEVGQAPSS